MTQRFDKPKDLMDWQRERITESTPLQRRKETYAAQCRAFDNGIQHIENAGVTERGLQKFVHENFTTAGGDNAVRMTMNRITTQRIRNAAKTNPQRFETVALRPTGISSPRDIAGRTLWQSIANATIDSCKLVEQASIANEERTIDGLHGFGVRIRKHELGDGSADAHLESFTYNGYELSLDPSNKSTNLRDHEWVILSTVMTKTKAERVYGASALQGIKDSDLQTVGQLKPTEMAFHHLSGGMLYPDVAQHSKSLGLVVRTTWIKGPTDRFDRMYVVLDTKAHNDSAGDRIINFENPVNPYGGDGMPLGLLRGYRRASSPCPISDVGMMIDDQKKSNLAATIWFNAYWDYVQKIYLVERSWFANGHALSANEILQMLEQGIAMGSGNPNASAPQIMTTPQPPQIIGEDLERWSSHLREGVFGSDQHIGRTKTHVTADASARAFTSAEAPLLDREQSDIDEYTRVIRTAAATTVNLARMGTPSVISMLSKSGMSNDQIGSIVSGKVDPMAPCELRLTQRALRRETRSEQINKVLGLVDRGAYDPMLLPQFFSEIDMPLNEGDRITREWTEQEVEKIVSGEPYDPVPLGPNRMGFMLDALRLAMIQTSGDFEVRDRLMQAYQAQIDLDMPEEAGEGDPAPQPPEELTLQDVVGGPSA